MPPTDPLGKLSVSESYELALLARSLSYKEVGVALYLTEATIKGYVSDILGKLHLQDRTQAALLAVRYGLVQPNDPPDVPRPNN